MKINSIVKYLKPVMWKNKVGHYTFVFPFFNRRIKVYQAANSCHAEFLKKTLNHPEFSRHFHSILLNFNKYLFAEWIEGKSGETITDSEKLWVVDRIASVQASLHQIAICENDKETCFDYLGYLEKRLIRFAPPEMDLDQVTKLLIIASSPPVYRSSLSHPDITLRNTVIENGSGDCKIIDNELLTQSPYFLLDVFNTCYSLYPKSKMIHHYLNRYYSYQNGYRLQPGWETSLAAAWAIRIAGSQFQAKMFQEGFESLEHWFERNQEIVAMIENTNTSRDQASNKALK
jgi:hypothetical protein